MCRTLKLLAAVIVVLCTTAPAMASADTVPLNHYSLASKNDHIYLTGGAPTGYATQPIVGWVESTGTPEQAIWRMRRTTAKPYNIAVTAAQKAAYAAQGYAAMSIVGYRLPDGSPDTLSTFQLQSPAGDFILTGDYVEANAKKLAGWTEVGQFGGIVYQVCKPWPKVGTSKFPDANGRLAIDFEAADPWENVQSMLSVPCSPGHGAHVVAAPRRQGSFAGWFPINQGDQVGTLWGDRDHMNLGANPFIGPDGTSELQERYVSFSVLLPDTFRLNLAADANRGAVLLYEQKSGTSVPYPNQPLTLSADSSTQQVRIHVAGGPRRSDGKAENLQDVNLGSIESMRNQWQDFVIHSKYCYDNDCANNGLVELWHNGAKKAEIHGANMYDSQRVNAYIGNYRPDVWTDHSDVYFDAWKMGNSYAEVAP